MEECLCGKVTTDKCPKHGAEERARRAETAREILEAALTSVNTPAKLRKRFSAYLSVNDDLRPIFTDATLDFENRRLLGFYGIYLQWQTRKCPDNPTCYENQQTTIGSVLLKQFRPVVKTGGER